VRSAQSSRCFRREERDLPHSAGERASDEERVTLSFRDLRAVAGLAIVGANLTRHD